MVAATQAAIDAFNAAALTRAYEARDEDRAVDVVSEAMAAGDAVLQDRFHEEILAVVVAGAEVEADAANDRGGFQVAKKLDAQVQAAGEGPFFIDFDALNPEVVTYARNSAGRLITETGFTADQLPWFRQLLGDAFDQFDERGFRGVPPSQLALDIRGKIGLSGPQREAMARLEQRLADQGMGPAAIKRRLAASHRRGIRYRALSIARTEVITAANEGQRQLWSQAQAQGLLPLDVNREWIANAGACPVCVDLDGEVVGINEQFSSGTYGPTAHPRCRCDTGLTELPKTETVIEGA